MSFRLPPVVRTLIRRHVRSVGELELLMVLHAERDRACSVDEICEVLSCPRSWAVAQPRAMASAGLLAPTDGKWRFAPASTESITRPPHSRRPAGFTCGTSCASCSPHRRD